MKRILKMTAFAIVLLLGSSLRSDLSAQYNDGYYDNDRGYESDREVSYQTFYDELSPHGRWVEYPGQGYVWVPDAGPDFRPYSTNGHWVYTDDYEWMWVSDYDWGWAPFHYGRWDYDNHYGWYWVPGYEWSPAWVAWRDGGDYYGWAPIRPGINISVNFNIGMYAPPVNFWVFSPRRYITSPRLYDYCIDPRRNVTIINYTTIITNNYRYSNNYGFRCGPRRYDAERYMGRISPVRLRNSYTPGRSSFRNNEVSIFRPQVRRDQDRNIAPRRFDRYDANAGRISGRNDSRENNTNPDRRVFDRTDRTTGNNNGNVNNDRRFERRNDDPVRDRERQTVDPNQDRRFEKRDNPGNGNNDRRFERRNNDDAVRQQQQQQMEQRRQQQQMEQRKFDRRSDDAVRQQQQQQQMEQRRQQQQMEQRKFDRRNDDAVRQQQQQQMEQRRQSQQMEQRRQVEQPRQPQQMEQRKFDRRNDDAVRQQQPVRQQQAEQPRQFERRDNGNGGDNGNGRNKKSRE